MYLEPIFASEDIKTQLPNESKKYSSVERSWKRIMRNAHESPKVCKLMCNIEKSISSTKIFSDVVITYLPAYVRVSLITN